MKFLDQMDLQGKRLLIRVDYNVPIKDGVIGDDNRIQASLPTLRLALEKGAALILFSHMGKPKGKIVPELSLKPVGERLSTLMGQEVIMAPDCVGAEIEEMAKALQPGQIMLLENLRYHEGETKNDPDFARGLAALGEIYCNDAFGTAHRAHASTVGITKYGLPCCAGLLMKKEWEYLGEALKSPKRPYVAISGGAKVSSKLGILNRLLDEVDSIVIGGAMANTFWLAQGKEVGTSLVEKDLVDQALDVLRRAKEKNVEIILPVDFVYGDGPDAPEAGGTCDADSIPADKMVLDTGPKSAELFRKALSGAKTVVWNGPVGAFENSAFAEGSITLARDVAALKGQAMTIIGGGDTDAVIHKVELQDEISFISTGGGSFLEFLEGKVLPAFEALEEC